MSPIWHILGSIIFLAIAMISLAQATTLPLGGITLNTPINKKIISLKEMRFHNVVRQGVDYSCGAAALATILRHAYHYDIDEEAVLDGLFEVADAEKVLREGFSLLDLKKYVDSMGMQGLGYSVTPADLQRLQVPVIVLLNLGGFQHFVVLKKIDNDKAYIADPSLGNQIIPVEEFVKSWNNVLLAVVGQDYDPNTVLLKPQKQASARKLYNATAPTSITNMIEFGYNFRNYF